MQEDQEDQKLQTGDKKAEVEEMEVTVDQKGKSHI